MKRNYQKKTIQSQKKNDLRKSIFCNNILTGFFQFLSYIHRFQLFKIHFMFQLSASIHFHVSLSPHQRTTYIALHYSHLQDFSYHPFPFRIQISIPGFLLQLLIFTLSISLVQHQKPQAPWASLSTKPFPYRIFSLHICSYIPDSKHNCAIFLLSSFFKLNVVNAFASTIFQRPNILGYKINRCYIQSQLAFLGRLKLSQNITEGFCLFLITIFPH